MGVAFALLAAGAQEVYALDVQRCVELSNTDPYEAVISECQRVGHLPQEPNILSENLVSRLHYELVNDDGRWPVEDHSIDVVYSYFSGEHLRRPADVVHAIHRALQPDGMCIFAIDLEDHLHREDNWLQFLYYEWLWEAMTSRRGCWTNRLLTPDWRALFERHFDDVRITETKRPLPSKFDAEGIASTFKKYNLSTLSTCCLWLVAARPRQPLAGAMALKLWPNQSVLFRHPTNANSIAWQHLPIKVLINRPISNRRGCRTSPQNLGKAQSNEALTHLRRCCLGVL
jgi:SAM-dependent methyltransferase